MPVKKVSEEWVAIRYFREKYAQFPKGKLIKSESPDFILKLNRKKSIGIEITRLDYLLRNNFDNWSELLSRLLEKKEDKLPLYKKSLLNEYWLIITTETADLAEISECAGQQTSTFDKVFLLDMFSGKIEEVA
jgi:hypothetical protein